ncbi:hypothetical protein BDB00DRAFT_828511 [Zychaea mexicana]|uniref:uncharacterized protein n=1 Tax=Zychaea mexicana TaxID=64656 RepID=UPI0022FE8AD9|nr:uncharacterized protein BDB00DRAFT_828511 [Zychaea mexicana]KAI9492500.1 hypothetical protein BDB00DRAFT_828511 [Zychaea mexicana]
MCAARSAKIGGGLIEERERYLEVTILAFATYQRSTHTQKDTYIVTVIQPYPSVGKILQCAFARRKKSE